MITISLGKLYNHISDRREVLDGGGETNYKTEQPAHIVVNAKSSALINKLGIMKMITLSHCNQGNFPQR